MSQTRLPTIDVASSPTEWKKEILDKTGLTELKQGRYFCLGKSHVIARQHLPKGSTIFLKDSDKIPDFDMKSEEDEKNQIAAISIDNILVSKAFNPAVRERDIWMNHLHVQMIKELLGEGFKIEILDEEGQVVRELE